MVPVVGSQYQYRITVGKCGYGSIKNLQLARYSLLSDLYRVHPEHNLNVRRVRLRGSQPELNTVLLDILSTQVWERKICSLACTVVVIVLANASTITNGNIT